MLFPNGSLANATALRISLAEIYTVNQRFVHADTRFQLVYHACPVHPLAVHEFPVKNYVGTV